MKIGIVAGEASGDLLGAQLIQALKALNSDLVIEGIGGPEMIALGCKSFFDIDNLAVMGFIEPLKRLPQLIHIRKTLYQHFKQNPPDVFIGIDAPDFNLGLERKLKQLKIPVIHYVSPSVWAWRQYRIHKIKQSMDLMLTLLPFEAKFYEKHKVPVKYIGHPLADKIELESDTLSARRALCLEEDGIYVAMLPGSRRQELKYISETFLRAAVLTHQKKPELKFITSQVNEARFQEFYAAYQTFAPHLPLKFYTKRMKDVLAAADVVIVTSGTATLEAMLYKKPMIIAYRMSKFTYFLARWLVKVTYFGLPNLIANKLLVPELLQDKANPDTICHYVLDYLDSPEKIKFLKTQFRQMHGDLKLNAAHNAASAVMDLVAARRGCPEEGANCHLEEAGKLSS